MLILGIETSCDETAVAIVKDGRTVLASEVFSQITKHQKWGGVIPEYASRMHLETLSDLIKQTFYKLDFGFETIDAIAVTQGPGLIGSLLIGVNTAKVLAWTHKKPLIPVNHLHGHICANYIDSDLEPPFVCLLVSGGHTQLIQVRSFTQIEILGETVDDAAGEAFDKVGRLMDLPYPGGPELDKLASSYTGDLKCSHPVESTAITNGYYRFPIAKVSGLDFSFSGLKTSVLRLKQKLGDEYWEIDKNKIASAFQKCLAETLYQKTLLALEKTELKTLVVAGGVAANSEIRRMFQEKFSDANGYKLFIPSLKYCTDNAAMIASAGYFKFIEDQSKYSNFGFEVYSKTIS
jgi:N6-L-threonylcarbamoyladenine synthase